MFGLADRLGMTVKTLARTVDGPELAGWMAYFRLQQSEPQEQAVEDKLKAAFGKKRK